MLEASPNNPRNPEDAKRYQVSLLVTLNQQINESIHTAWKDRSQVSDYAVDVLTNYCTAIARSDPDMGHMLVEELESPDGAGGQWDLELSDVIRKELGMPRIDWPIEHDSLPLPQSDGQ